MDAPCLPCSSGPFGFAGHADLNVQTVGDARMMLRCRSCGSFWSRTLEREGYFSWGALTERMACSPRMGIAVPPLSTDAGSCSLPWRGIGHSPWLDAIMARTDRPHRDSDPPARN